MTRVTRYRLVPLLGLLACALLFTLAVACGDDDDDDDDDENGATAVATSEPTEEGTPDATATGEAGTTDIDPDVEQYVASFCTEFDQLFTDLSTTAADAGAGSLTEEEAFAEIEQAINAFADRMDALDPPPSLQQWQDDFVALLRENAADPEAFSNLEPPEPPADVADQFNAAGETIPECQALSSAIGA
ncbi:MAG TPA: hypothetical protein VNL92_05690 [Dehalococcoidia bacterium]|nr:hypothetical protein [Dehalococcoidia bacterium]